MNEFYPNSMAPDEKEIVYIDEKARFLSRIDAKSPRGIITIQKLNLANIEKKYSDIQWKYGQLQRAISYYDSTVGITDSPPEDLPIWTPSEREKLSRVMNGAYPPNKPNA